MLNFSSARQEAVTLGAVFNKRGLGGERTGGVGPAPERALLTVCAANQRSTVLRMSYERDRSDDR